MKVSLDWIGDYVDLPPLRTDQIMHDLTMTTVEVEGAEDWSERLASVVIGRVEALQAIDGSDMLTRASCDVGAGPRLTIVSAARNLRPGLAVAVALPSARIRRAGAPEPDEVRAVDVRGIRSEAMICRAAELGLEDLFPDIDLTSALDLGELAGAAGDPLAAAIGWNDIVLEIDNKSLTNRPDLWGHYGIARELAAIYGATLKPLAPAAGPFPPAALVGDVEPRACGQFTIARIADVRMETAPLWMRSRLARVGQRPINLYVDLTNYVMLAVGQPTHAYDADRVALPLGVRFARTGETLRLLDGRDYDLDPSILAIVDARGPVAAAGIMGGMPTSISPDANEILLELANFDAQQVRRASTRLGVRSEASARFEKAVDTQRVGAGLDLFVSLLGRIQPGAAITGFQEVSPRPTVPNAIDLQVSFIQGRLGIPIAAEKMAQKLRLLGFTVTHDAETLHVAVPSWRSTGDVSLPHDLVEEVARLYGYDNIAFTPPEIRLEHATTDRRGLLERRLKELLAFAGGVQEVVSYPWVKDRFLEAAGFDPGTTLRLAAPPAPDQGSLQPSLVPSLLESIVVNQRYLPSFRIFQTGPVFLNDGFASIDDSRERLPRQPRRLAAALVGPDAEGLFREAKGLIEMLRQKAHINSLELTPDAPAEWADAAGRLGLEAGGKPAGTLGVLSNRAKRIAGVKRGHVVVFELDIDALQTLEVPAKSVSARVGVSRGRARSLAHVPRKRHLGRGVRTRARHVCPDQGRGLCRSIPRQRNPRRPEIGDAAHQAGRIRPNAAVGGGDGGRGAGRQGARDELRR